MRARRISSVGQLRKILKDKNIPDNAPLWVSISPGVSVTGTPVLNRVTIWENATTVKAESLLNYAGSATFGRLELGQSDVANGNFRAYGNDDSSGGTVQLFNAALEDTFVDEWRIEANGDLRMSIAGTTPVLTLDDQLYVPFASNASVANIDTVGNAALITREYFYSNIQKTNGYTFATLPASPGTGDTAYITDANTPTWRGNASGGGSDFALVIYDGTNWIYH